LAVGTADGYINILKYPFTELNSYTNDSIIPSDYIYDKIKSHRSEITHLFFSKETNLLFSCGKDGNLFVYCIHETNENNDMIKENVNNIISVLDEGLGENVLYSLEKLFKTQENLDIMKKKIAENYHSEQSLVKDYERQIREKEKDYLKKKENEMKMLNDIIKEIKINNENTIEYYENQIKQLIHENNKIIIDKENTYSESLTKLSEDIRELNKKISIIKTDHEIAMRFKDDEYDRKFKELERELKKKFEELRNKNEKLSEELINNKKLEDIKFAHIDNEHEEEINQKIEKYENLLFDLREEKLKLTNENIQLKEALKAKEYLIQDKDSKIKKMSENIENISLSLQNYKKLNDIKDRDFKDLKDKLIESERALQEKSKLASFSMKLKNELYKKNTEISATLNIQHENMGDLKANSKNIEKELEDAMRMLENNEKEIKKYRLLISELKKKLEEEHLYAKSKATEYDDLLQRFYEVFQSNDKNTILKGLRQIYSIYLTPEVLNKIEAGKLNINIRDELEKQIEFLQKSLLNINDLKNKKENIQKNEIFKRTTENSVLISELNEKIRSYTLLERDFNKMKSDYSAMIKTVDNYKRQEYERKIGVGINNGTKNLVTFNSVFINIFLGFSRNQ
jgi:myosin heavy subunit